MTEREKNIDKVIETEMEREREKKKQIYGDAEKNIEMEKKTNVRIETYRLIAS